MTVRGVGEISRSEVRSSKLDVVHEVSTDKVISFWYTLCFVSYSVYCVLVLSGSRVISSKGKE